MTATAAQRAAWSLVPVDEVGYLPSAGLLALGDDELRAVIAGTERGRYGGWRNHEGLWVKAMRLGEARGLRVLDFGCGTGVEALQYARAGAVVSVADIVRDNALLAERVLGLYGYAPEHSHLIGGELPVAIGPYDVIHMSGVLHHVPEPVPLIKAAAGWLAPGGEIRLMVYSDRGWRIATDGGEPPAEVAGHPDHQRFIRFFDGVGDWADWYDEARLADRFGEWFTVHDVTYITPDDRYLTATLRRC